MKIRNFICLLALSLSGKAFAKDSNPGARSPEETALLEYLSQIGPVPEYDPKNPKAKGIVVSFVQWPAKQADRDHLIKRLEKAGLSKKEEFPLFKSIVFEWEEWKRGAEAQKICESLSGISYLEDCNPDFLLGPAFGFIRKKFVKPKVDDRLKDKSGPATPPKGGIQLNPPPVKTNGTGNVKTCNIVPSQLGHKGLSDYWGQEMIGSDLMKEELKKAPPTKKHLASVWDTPFGHRHDMAVKNLVSGAGRQAVLPPLKNNNMTNFNVVYHTTGYMRAASHLHRAADKKCRDSDRRDDREGDNGMGP